MKQKQKNNNQASALNRILRQPDLSVLGNAIRSLPPAQWQQHMFFIGVPDTEFRSLTGGAFPATMRKDKTTHPLFVLQCSPFGHLVCPCSSRGNPRRQRFIRRGCRLAMSDWEIHTDSFLVEQYSLTIPLDRRFSRKLIFKGKVPNQCLDGGEAA